MFGVELSSELEMEIGLSLCAIEHTARGGIKREEEDARDMRDGITVK